MFIVRNCFLAKPGQASKLAALLKDVTTTFDMHSPRVMTDVTGEFNRVVMEYSAENIGEFEANMKRYMSDPAIREKMKGYTDLWSTGSREIMQVV
jgi:hypothetical protein